MHFFRRSKKPSGNAHTFPLPPPPPPWMPAPLYMPLPPPPSCYPGILMPAPPREKGLTTKTSSSRKHSHRTAATNNTSSRVPYGNTARGDDYWTPEPRKSKQKTYAGRNEVHRTPQGKEYTIRRHSKDASRNGNHPKKPSYVEYTSKKHVVKEDYRPGRSSGHKREATKDPKPRVEYEVTIIRKEIPRSKERHDRESRRYQQKSHGHREEHRDGQHLRSKSSETRNGARWYRVNRW